MEGPSKADIQCEDNADGTCQVKYTPTEPGNYIVNIKFADEHIKGSDITVISQSVYLIYILGISTDLKTMSKEGLSLLIIGVTFGW